MDKAEFIEKAPRYYALAVLSFLAKQNAAATVTDIIDDWSYTDEYSGQQTYRVSSGRLLDLALKTLTAEQLVRIEKDDFGPDIIHPAETLFSEFQPGSVLLRHPVYERYFKTGKSRNTWLAQALDGVARRETELGITDSDYDHPGSDWEPLPVERDKPEVQQVIAATDDAIEKIRTDNGYAANRPEERAYVLESLLAFAKRMKESASISVAYIRSKAIEPIRVASRTLGKASAGVALDVLRTKLKEWLLHALSFLPF